MFAVLRSPSRTSGLDYDTTDEPFVIETVNDTDIFADLRSPSRTSSLCPGTTEDYHFNAYLSPDTLLNSVVRSPSIMSSLEFIVLQESDTDEAVLKASRDALTAACEVDSSTLESASYLDCVI